MGLNTALRASCICVVAAIPIVLVGSGCAGGLGWSSLPIADGLEVVAAGDETPTIQVLAARTTADWDHRRAEIRAVSGRFREIRNSRGEHIAGGGIGALLFVDLDARQLRQVVLFTDPGAGAEAPVFGATSVQEPPEDDDWTYLRPQRVLVTVSGVFAGVDAGPRGEIEASQYVGALAAFDLYRPDVLNVAALRNEAAGAEPIAFGTPIGSVEGFYASVSGVGDFDAVRDLQRVEREVAGSRLRAAFDLRGGALTEFTALGTSALD